MSGVQVWRVPAIVSPLSVGAIIAFSLDAEVILLASQKLITSYLSHLSN
ncbi:hypothetical protein [Nostoc favosum]|uniref:Uncharacterized protein n=1 Tax=Nostoc favosum CHAB5714 TaxID=2780399 RepID=A0ABS8I2T9_9NOSO|nr:hypothetical protein [Nostoc favosum]MCC5598495.1 hypothetical protein [Nostoc favosum CHAB5714]